MIRKISAMIILFFVILVNFIPIKMSKESNNIGSKVSKDTVKSTTFVQQKPKLEKTSFEKCAKKEEKSLEKSEYELLCRTVYCEAGNQSIHTQTLVALTILNRVKDNKFPNTIKDVVYAPNAYAVTTWKNFENYKWTKQVEQAVKLALENNNHPKDMFYFRTEHYHKFGEPYMKSDDLWFSTEN